jgi:hypothetical protein
MPRSSRRPGPDRWRATDLAFDGAIPNFVGRNAEECTDGDRVHLHAEDVEGFERDVERPGVQPREETEIPDRWSIRGEVPRGGEVELGSEPEDQFDPTGR